MSVCGGRVEQGPRLDRELKCPQWLHVLQGIASIVQACAALRHHPGELLDAIIADMEARPSEYERDDWTAIVWALTRLARSPGRLYALLAQEVSLYLNVHSTNLPHFCLSTGEGNILSLPSCASVTQCLGCIFACSVLRSPELVYPL